MATLLDTSALVVLMRRHPLPEHRPIGEIAAAEMRSSRAVISVVTVTELLMGARDEGAETRIVTLIGHLPVVSVDRETATMAGRMGREARAAGATLPVPDLLIAATAVFLDVPLLTCDSDFGRGMELAGSADAASAWSGFGLHQASVVRGAGAVNHHGRSG